MRAYTKQAQSFISRDAVYRLIIFRWTSTHRCFRIMNDLYYIYACFICCWVVTNNNNCIPLSVCSASDFNEMDTRDFFLHLYSCVILSRQWWSNDAITIEKVCSIDEKKETCRFDLKKKMLSKKTRINHNAVFLFLYYNCSPWERASSIESDVKVNREQLSLFASQYRASK